MQVPTTLQDVPVTLALLGFVVGLVVFGVGLGMWISRVKTGASQDAREAETRATAAALAEVMRLREEQRIETERLREELKAETDRARTRNSELARSFDAYKLHVATTHPTHEHVAAVLSTIREDIKELRQEVRSHFASARRAPPGE